MGKFHQAEFFECECQSDEHVFKFSYDKEEGDFYLAVYLNQYRRWYQRVWVAVKYVFGYKSKFGHFDTTLVNQEDTKRLRDLCDHTLQLKKEWEAAEEHRYGRG